MHSPHWKPKVAIVGVDHVLWPFKMDQLHPPFVNHGDHVQDSNGHKLQLFPEAEECLVMLKAACNRVVLSYRTKAPGAHLLALLKAFGLSQYITSAVVDVTPFAAHLDVVTKSLKLEEEVEAKEVIAFLSEHGAIADAERAEAFTVFVSPKTGLTKVLVAKAIEADKHLNAVVAGLMPQVEVQPPQLGYHQEMLEQIKGVSTAVADLLHDTSVLAVAGGREGLTRAALR